MKRVIVRLAEDRETKGLFADRPAPPITGHYAAAKLASYGGDNVALEFPGGDCHVFSRDDGRWMSGPWPLPDAVVSEFDSFEADIKAGRSVDYEWVVAVGASGPRTVSP